MSRIIKITYFYKTFSIVVLSLALASCAVNSTRSALIYATHTLEESECVVLVHGLWRSGFAMRSIASDLEDHGYQTVSVDYPSTQEEIPELVQGYLLKSYEECAQTGAKKIHLVSHSMGGILIRQFLQSHSLPAGSRVVMLSPPNQGSELSEKFGESWWYQWAVGPAGVSLSANQGGIISKLREIAEPVGIIAAYRDWSVWPNAWLPHPNDGTVSVESMKLAEMDDFILVNSGHALMRFNDEVQSQIRQFLAVGEFAR
jgi:pimeloyl-ACP methyl ester carboxylesterase